MIVVQWKVQKRTGALPEARNLGAIHINQPIERHQQLDGLDLGVMRIEGSALVNKLVGKVLDGMAKDFKRMPRCGIDMPATVRVLAGSGSGRD